MQCLKLTWLRTTSLIAVFVCFFVFLGGFALASTRNCSDLFNVEQTEKYHELIKLLDPKTTLGLGIKAIGFETTSSNPYPLISMQIQLEFAYWDKPDIAGNYFWAQKLLKAKSADFGFLYTHLPNPNLQNVQTKSILGFTTFPSVEYANSAIEVFNQNVQNSKSRIPLKLQSTSGIATPLRFLNYLNDGLIPIAIDSGRTFVHDMNYHYLSLIVLKPEINIANQNRAKLGLNLLKFIQESYPAKRFEAFLGLKLISALVARLDQTGHFVPFVAQLKAGVTPDWEQVAYAKVLIKAIHSENDHAFFKELVVMVSRIVPKWSDFYSKNHLLSKSEIELIEKNFHYDHTNYLMPMQVYALVTIENLVNRYFSNSPSTKLQLQKVNETITDVLDVLQLAAEGKPLSQYQISLLKNSEVAD